MVIAVVNCTEFSRLYERAMESKRLHYKARVRLEQGLLGSLVDELVALETEYTRTRVQSDLDLEALIRHQRIHRCPTG